MAPDGRTEGQTEGRTDGRTDGRTEGRTDRHGQSYIPPSSAGDNNEAYVYVKINLKVVLQEQKSHSKRETWAVF